MTPGSEHRVWEWAATGSFKPRYDVRASAEGLFYYCEIQGPFCGYDAEGWQSWEEFLTVGAPAEFQMPAWIAAEISAHAASVTRPDP